MKNIFALLFIFIFSINAFAQKLDVATQKKVDDIFKKGEVVYFKFPVSSSQEVAPIAKEISVDKMQGTMVYAHADKEQFSKFIVRNYPYTIEKYGNASATKKAPTSSAKPATTPNTKK